MRNLHAAYSELPEASKAEIDSTAHRQAREVIEREQTESGTLYQPSVFESELALERDWQWEQLVQLGCSARIAELAVGAEADDGPEQRLSWALLRTQLQRKPDYVRPKTLAEWFERYEKARVEREKTP